MYLYNKQKTLVGMKGLEFLCREMYQYKWYSIFLPFLACISQVSQSLILIMLPKLVLDAISKNQSFEVLVTKTGLAGFGLIAATLANLFLHNEMDKCSQMFLFHRLTTLWQRKAIRLDYNVYISGKGKVLMEKARQVISSPNRGIVQLLSSGALLLEAMVGLIVYCMLVGSLHSLVLLFLGIIFLIELLVGIKIENQKQDYTPDAADKLRAINRGILLQYGSQRAKIIMGKLYVAFVWN